MKTIHRIITAAILLAATVPSVTATLPEASATLPEGSATVPEGFAFGPESSPTLPAPDGKEVLTEQMVRQNGIDKYFTVSNIDDATFARMQRGGSYPADCTIPRSELRYLRLLHYNYRGEIVQGEMVCNKAIAASVREVFKELYLAKYQIERMELIDNYKANDEASMLANNTSCFCYRKVAGRKVLSLHARGMAIDINPLHNPMVKRNASGAITYLAPNNDVARKYANRTTKLPHIITPTDACYKIFTKHGFRWGGSWRSSQDYQHFEKR